MAQSTFDNSPTAEESLMQTLASSPSWQAQDEAYKMRVNAAARMNPMDDAAANKLRMLVPLLQQVHGLDPQLQGFLLGKLGFPGAPSVKDKQAEQVKNQILMAGYKNELGQGQRDITNAGMQQRLALSQEQLAALIRQRQETNANAAQRTDIAAQTGSKPAAPFKAAQEAVIAAFNAGVRDPQELARIAMENGWQYGGGTSSTFAGINTGFNPNLTRISPTITGGSASGTAPQAAANAPQMMLIQNNKTGKQATGPAGPVPAGWKRIS